jgi:hypothetical protein
MADIDFYAAKIGDICNQNGDIRGQEIAHGSLIISSGATFVSRAQAEIAARYGWLPSGRMRDGMVEIERVQQH